MFMLIKQYSKTFGRVKMEHSVCKTLHFQTYFYKCNKRNRGGARRVERAENSPNQNNIFQLVPINLPSTHKPSPAVWVEEAVIKSTVGR